MSMNRLQSLKLAVIMTAAAKLFPDPRKRASGLASMLSKVDD